MVEYKYKEAEQFCLNTKCNWQGHRVTQIGSLCPLCGNKTTNFTGNDGFTMNSPQGTKHYPTVEYPEDYEPYEDNRSQFIHPMNEYYILGPDVKTSLPKNYHYSSMYKIKAGKGYRRDGHPVGVIGHQCPECEGHIISIQMCTSSRGFTTTSEKVCDTCGLIIPGSFQILEKIDEPYRGKYSKTHEEWIEQNTPDLDYDDVDSQLEASANYNGHRENTDDAEGYGDEYVSNHVNKDYAKRIQDAMYRLAAVPQSMHISSSLRNKHKHMLLVDDYAHELEMLPYQVADVKWIINHYPSILKMPYKIEKVLYNLCLYIRILGMGRKGTGIVNKARLVEEYDSTIYKTMRSTLNV